MHVSVRWLSRHVDLDGIDPEQVAWDLTLSTAEVEGVERFAPQLSDVVVGHVVECARHPEADKLRLCQVDVGGAGDGEPLPIVCGAPNVATGQKVAVATVGTVLPGDFKIKKSKIRGAESRGMICSLQELDIGDEHDGIWVLDDDAEVGRPVASSSGRRPGRRRRLPAGSGLLPPAPGPDVWRRKHVCRTLPATRARTRPDSCRAVAVLPCPAPCDGCGHRSARVHSAKD